MDFPNDAPEPHEAPQPSVATAGTGAGATDRLPQTSPEGVAASPLAGGLVSLSAGALPGETLDTLLARLRREALRRSLDIVQGNIFADPRSAAGLADSLEFPVSVLARHDTPAGDLRGARLAALPHGAGEKITGAGGRPAGVRWTTDAGRFILLGALAPGNTGDAPDAQSAALWRDLKTLLGANGFALTDLVRTWFFNNRILEWYDAFNRVRTDFFNANNIFGTLVPASTGVGCSNATGAALTLDALAVIPNPSGSMRAQAVPSPLQCPANDYKSAFSRAVELDAPEGRHLFVSGTASIAPGGETAHLGDLDAQIKLSLQVVAAILESRSMSWNDVARAVLYFPQIEWMSRFVACRDALALPEIPAVFAHADICRDDLLFEIELDAFKK